MLIEVVDLNIVVDDQTAEVRAPCKNLCCLHSPPFKALGTNSEEVEKKRILEVLGVCTRLDRKLHLGRYSKSTPLSLKPSPKRLF